MVTPKNWVWTEISLEDTQGPRCKFTNTQDALEIHGGTRQRCFQPESPMMKRYQGL